MPAPTRISRKLNTLLSPDEAARAVDRVKLLMALRDFNGKDLWDALAPTGHPGTYSSLLRFLNNGRIPTAGEVQSLARFFKTSFEVLTGEPGAKVRRQQRLIEFDMPAGEPIPSPAPEAPRERLRPAREARLGAGDVRALAEAVEALTAAVREQTAVQATGQGIRLAG